MKNFKFRIFNVLRSVFRILLFEVLLTKLIRSNRIYSNISFLEEHYDHTYEVETKNKITKTCNLINKEMDIVAISSKVQY